MYETDERKLRTLFRFFRLFPATADLRRGSSQCFISVDQRSLEHFTIAWMGTRSERTSQQRLERSRSRVPFQ